MKEKQNDNTELIPDFNIDIFNDNIKENKCSSCVNKPNSQVIKRNEKYIMRRASSEIKLLDILDMNFEEGYSYHCISSGDIDSLSYLKHIVRQQDIKYLLFSTWCMTLEDVKQFNELIAKNKIERLNAYVGEIFQKSYQEAYEELKKTVTLTKGRLAIFRNHTKIYAGFGNKFYFVVESSANINTNPRAENTVISTGKDIYDFYKDWFDNIKSFNRDFDDWIKYE